MDISRTDSMSLDHRTELFDLGEGGSYSAV
jgi:hypothetical protein